MVLIPNGISCFSVLLKTTASISFTKLLICCSSSVIIKGALYQKALFTCRTAL